MADEMSCSPIRSVECYLLDRYSQGQIRSLILSNNEPMRFTGASVDWSCSRWTPEFLASQLGNLQTTFKICARVGSPFYKFDANKVVMEIDCVYKKASLLNYCAWLKDDLENAGDLAQFSRAHFWCYADYKYMAEVFEDFPALREAPEWEMLGFPELSGDQSTIWIGSDGAYTPCHLDTYGCNLVAQIYGRKKWILFPPFETNKLYPTRIPYEESSIFSQVNVKNPNLALSPQYSAAVKYEVILEPGDVLLVPRHWWHFVESLGSSISINTWITLDSDHVDRIREAVTRTLVCSLKSSEGECPRYWLNPSERAGAHRENLEYIQRAVTSLVVREEQQERMPNCGITANDIIDCITSPKIVSDIADQLMEKARRKNNITTFNKSPKHCFSREASEHNYAQCGTVDGTLNCSPNEPCQNTCSCTSCSQSSSLHAMVTRQSKRHSDCQQYLGQGSVVIKPFNNDSPSKPKKKRPLN